MLRQFPLVMLYILLVAVGSAQQPIPTTRPDDVPDPADVRAKLTALRSELAEASRTFQRPVMPGALPLPSADINETVHALAMLQVEKGFDYLEALPPDSSRALAALGAARVVLRSKGSRMMPDVVKYGRLTEHAYIARNDRSPQPYFLFKPSNYVHGKKYPLVVFLHGYVPETSRTIPYLVSDFVLDMAEEKSALLLIPHGRTNTDFQYAGEVDVLRSMAEVKQFYSVDDSRIYLLGVSMGGAGVWHLATHYPDLFSAVAPINAQGDWFRFWRELFNYPPRNKLPHHIQQLLATNNPVDLATNLKHLYSYSQHATHCFVGPAHTKAMVDRLRSVGAPHDYYEDPSELGHYIYWRPDCWQRAFDKLFQDRAPSVSPRTIDYTTYSLRYPGAYWAEITGFRHWGKVSKLKAQIVAEDKLDLTTENVAGLTIAPPRKWLSEKNRVEVVWNGKQLGRRKLTAEGTLTLQLPGTTADEAEAPGFKKSRTVCGPAADVFNFPFLVVRGTGGSPQAREQNATLTDKFVRDWFEYAEGRATVVTDVDLTDKQMRDNGLVLIGFPDENSILAECANRLPIKIDGNTIALPDGKSYSRAEHGLLLTYPNPKFPSRYILVYAGKHWGASRSSNHKFDCIPDFTIFSEETVLPVGYNRYRAAGFFDTHWQYDPGLTDFLPPVSSSGE